jgi:CRP-like cAMP-binding protein
VADHETASQPVRTPTYKFASRGLERSVSKLNASSNLTDADKQAIRDMSSVVRKVPAKSDIISEGDPPDHTFIMLGGWAARYKVVADGSRQITAFLIPGDFGDLHVTILVAMDHGIVALTPTRVAFVSDKTMEQLPIDRPQLGRALSRSTLLDEAILRSWIVNIGRRPALERIAHLFCELHARLALVGLVENDRFDLPITQEVIADATGLTPVHVNRMLRQLRADGLIVLRRGALTIVDLPGLRKVAGFDPNYLHRGRLI